jgi:hypothetical protein
MRRYVFIFIIALAIGAPRLAFGADEDEAQSAPVTFDSILPKVMKRGPNQNPDKIDYIGISDKALQKELAALKKRCGYNYFEAFKSRPMDAVEEKTIEYRLDDSMDRYCKFTIDKIETWIDDKDKEHTYITYTATVVNRTVEEDANGKKVVIDDDMITVNRRREAGKYLIMVFPEFYPESDDEPARDFILAVKVGG